MVEKKLVFRKKYGYGVNITCFQGKYPFKDDKKMIK